MHVVTHLLAGWCAGAATRRTGRDLALAAWAGAAPDLDGVGLIVDAATRRLGMPETDWYSWHHVYGHGLPAALVIAGLVAVAARDKLRAALAAFLTVHLHLLGDVVGSRGADPRDVWEISYLSPFTDTLHVVWSGQWQVVGWQNTTITAALFALSLALTVRYGTSLAGLVSARADRAVVDTLRTRWARLRGRSAAGG